MLNDESLKFQTVCQVGDIPKGEARMFVVAGLPIGVFNVDGNHFALANECPHAGASLAHGILDGDRVSCRIHHWCFSVRDGTYLDEGKSQYNAESFPVRVVGDDVQVAISG